MMCHTSHVPDPRTLIGSDVSSCVGILEWRGHVFSVLSEYSLLDTSLCTILLLYYTDILYHRVASDLLDISTVTLEVWKLSKIPTLGKHHPP